MNAKDRDILKTKNGPIGKNKIKDKDLNVVGSGVKSRNDVLERSKNTHGSTNTPMATSTGTGNSSYLSQNQVRTKKFAWVKRFMTNNSIPEPNNSTPSDSRRNENYVSKDTGKTTRNAPITSSFLDKKITPVSTSSSFSKSKVIFSDKFESNSKQFTSSTLTPDMAYPAGPDSERETDDQLNMKNFNGLDQRSISSSMNDSEIRMLQLRDIQSIENDEMVSFISSANTSLKAQEAHERQFYNRHSPPQLQTPQQHQLQESLLASDTHTISSVKSIFSGGHGSIQSNNAASINTGGNNRIVFGNYLTYTPLPQTSSNNNNNPLPNIHESLSYNTNNNIYYPNSYNMDIMSTFSGSTNEDNVSTKPLVSLSSDEEDNEDNEADNEKDHEEVEDEEENEDFDTDADYDRTSINEELNCEEDDVASIRENEVLDIHETTCNIHNINTHNDDVILYKIIEEGEEKPLNEEDQLSSSFQEQIEISNEESEDENDEDIYHDSGVYVSGDGESFLQGNAANLDALDLANAHEGPNLEVVSSTSIIPIFRDTTAVSNNIEHEYEYDSSSIDTRRSRYLNSSKSTGITSVSIMSTPPLTTINSSNTIDTNMATTAASVMTLASSSRRQH